MTIFRLTTDSESIGGTDDADTFDGYEFDDGLGHTGGNDTLQGNGGEDLFLLNSNYSLVSGLIDGGDDHDTVRAYGFDLGSLAFVDVEDLSIESYEFGASLAQLNAFSTITTSLANVSRIQTYLLGAGGTIDVSGRIAPGMSVDFDATGLSTGYVATGTSQADIFKNSSHNDVVHGGSGADTLLGIYRDGYGGGSDQLFGDGGSDTFQLRRQSGTIDGGSGVDTVIAYQFTSGFGSRLGDLGGATFVNVERLSTGPNITIATIAQLNAFATITGGNANGVIQFDIKGGAGGIIDFSTRLKQADEHIALRALGSTSAIDATGTARDDTLAGSAHDDRLSGGEGDDYLAGADFVAGPSGNDTLFGGLGSDTYYVDANDRIVDLFGPLGGIDTVISTGSYNLANTVRLQGDFENLILNGYLGAENPNTRGYGNAHDNEITGNGGSNYLDGREGADHLIGRAGDDTFVVDDIGDVVEERTTRNEGVDRVLSFVDFDLGDPLRAIGFVENLVLKGSAPLDGFGNEEDNQLVGNSGANLLDGRGGQDIMVGLEGDDTYHVADTEDRVREADGGGFDTVYASATYRLGNQSVESLILTGEEPINGTGNDMSNLIVGNSADNVIRGGGGEDTLNGGGGNDRIHGDAGRDFMAGEEGDDIFVFTLLTDSNTAPGAADEISGFAAGDRIAVRHIDANSSLGGDQAFVLDADSTFSEGEIRQTVQGSNLLIEFNADDDPDADMSILLTSRTTFLTSTDFIL